MYRQEDKGHNDGWPERLYHQIPSWVESGSIFHVRIRCASSNPVSLVDPMLAASVLGSVRLYDAQQRWSVQLFLLMGDHLHALLSFPADPGMAKVISDWKRFQTRRNGVLWQDNFFDHRIRSPKELQEKWAYVRRNPVVKGLCADEDMWPWVLDRRDMGVVEAV